MPVIVVNRRDLVRATFRSGGPGGQNQNKRDTGVRWTHLPTGLSAEGREHKTQAQNSTAALVRLVAKLKAHHEALARAARDSRNADKARAGFGSGDRSYVLDRDRRVVDHRTGAHSGDPAAVLDGGIDTFINAHLRRA